MAEAQLALRSPAGLVLETTDTDHEGRFRLPDVGVGHYDLVVQAEGFAPGHYPQDVTGDMHDLELRLSNIGGVYQTIVQAQRARRCRHRTAPPPPSSPMRTWR